MNKAVVRMDILGTLLQACVLSVICFTIVSLSMPPLMSKLSRIGSVKKDLHKKESTVPSPCGLSVMLGFSAGATITGLLGLDNQVLLLIYLVTLIGSLVGLVDDFLNLEKKTMVLITLTMGFPLVAYYRGSSIVILPFAGAIDLGFWFWPLSILGIAFLSNAVNIYAPLNGLETGAGFISCLGLSACALIYGSFESLFALILMASSLLAALRWDHYPSRVFLGNIGSYMTGTLIASAVVVGAIKTAAIIACIPYIVNFVLRAKDRFKKYVATVTDNELIVSEIPTTLWALFILRKPRSERIVVYYCWAFQAVFSIAAVIFALMTTSVQL